MEVVSVDWSDDEVVEQGSDPGRPSRLARWGARIPATIRVGVLGLAAVAVLVTALATHQAHRPAPAKDTAPAAEQVATDRAMALIEANARAGGLHDYIRSNSSRGACMLVPVGGAPERDIAAAITRTLPGYRVRDVSRTIDQFTALCAMSVRAVDVQGSVLVVSVAAPQQATTRPFTELTVGARTEPRDAVSIATALTTSGWSITVGVVGPLADEPSSADLQRLSQDPGLLW